MRTLLITLEYPPFRGGIASYYGHLVKYWPWAENIEVLDNSHGELLAKNWRLPLAWWPALFSGWRRLKRRRIDYVLVGHILPLGSAAFIWSFFKPVRYGVFLHGLDFSSALSKPHRRWLARLILRRAKNIICANSYLAKQVIAFDPSLAEKLRLINPGVEQGTPRLGQEIKRRLETDYGLEGKTVIFSLGRLVKRKGFDKSIAAISLLPKDVRENILYFIAGTGPDEDRLRSLVPLELSRQIRFLGVLSEDQKWAWLCRCDIFLMPSRDIGGDYEGFGIVYLEANLCGRPVIGGRQGGVSDAISHEESGLLVNGEDEADIASAIARLSQDRELREKLGSQGRKRAGEEFNWEKQAQAVCDMIKEKI